MEEQKEQALIGHAQSARQRSKLGNFVTYEHLQKTLFWLLHNLKTIYEYKHMEREDLGKPLLAPP